MNEREKRDFMGRLVGRGRRGAARRTDAPHLHQALRPDAGDDPAVRRAARLGELDGAGAGRGARWPTRAPRSARRRPRPGPPPPKARRTARPSAPPRPPRRSPGVTLSLTYEAGLQALDPRNFSGPMWEKLTGIKTNVVELAWPRPLLQGGGRAYRRLGRLRRARRRADVDAVARRRRRDPAARRLHRQVHERGGPRRLPSALQGAADLQGQDLGLLRRRRHLRALLPQGHLRGSEADGGLPGQVRHAARAAEDLAGIHPDRPVHHRQPRAERLRRRATSARRAARATSSTSCSSSAPTAGSCSTRT